MQVSYDKQGTGLSDLHRTDFTLDRHMSELEALILNPSGVTEALAGFLAHYPLPVTA